MLIGIIRKLSKAKKRARNLKGLEKRAKIKMKKKREDEEAKGNPKYA